MSDIHSEGSYPSNTSLEDEMREMAGYRTDDQEILGVLNADQVDDLNSFTRTDIDQGDMDEDDELSEPFESLDDLVSENLREGETDDAMESVQEGLSYVPPIDAPMLDGDYDPDDALDQEDASLGQRIRVQLRHDSSTEVLASHIEVVTRDHGIVELHGMVSDLTDEELVISVVEHVEGVEEVESYLQIAGIDEND